MTTDPYSYLLHCAVPIGCINSMLTDLEHGTRMTVTSLDWNDQATYTAIHFSARRRSDGDKVLLRITNTERRQLIPLLKKFKADKKL